MPNDVGLLLAFTAGIVSFASPCVLPLVPGYLSFVSGLSLQDLESKAHKHVWTIASSIGLFILGFSVVFVLMGLGFSFMGGVLLEYQDKLMKAAGILVIFFGLFMLGMIKFQALYNERRFHLTGRYGKFGNTLLGMAFAFGWTPCIGPILGSILAFAATGGDTGRGAQLLAVYSLGLGVPFMLSGLLLSKAVKVFGWFKRNQGVMNGIAGVMMISIGTLLFLGKFNILNSMLFKFFRSIGLDVLATGL